MMPLSFSDELPFYVRNLLIHRRANLTSSIKGSGPMDVVVGIVDVSFQEVSKTGASISILNWEEIMVDWVRILQPKYRLHSRFLIWLKRLGKCRISGSSSWLLMSQYQKLQGVACKNCKCENDKIHYLQINKSLVYSLTTLRLLKTSDIT